MGWVEQRGNKFRLSFRYGGKLYRHSLGVDNQKQADESLSLVERNLRLLEEGILDLPRGADLALFLLSGGKLTAKPEVHESVTLGRLVEQYMEAHVGAQESNTIYTARIHANHVTKTLGIGFAIQNLTAADLQSHVERRRKVKLRGGKPLSAATIKKEITGLSGVWSWAVRMGHLTGIFPNRGLVYPKSTQKPPFHTRAEIEEQIKRGGLTENEQRELWGSLFLTLPEVAELLELVRANARHDWIYPMFCFAAHTGARRSEILRSRISDFDFQAKSVLIRERKRAKGRLTTRRVPLSGFLASVMRAWFDTHPGGIHSISQPLNVFRSKKTRTELGPVTVSESNHHFNATIKGSKWEVVPGWHALRHSFCSNCAARGVDQRLINAWVGHTTLEMQQRYAHLIPSVAKTALDSVFE